MIPLGDGQPTRRFPVITVALIVANLAVWLLYELPYGESAIVRFSFYPCAVEASCPAAEPWGVSWVTAMFMHVSWSHIIGNMWFLAIFGNNVEDAFRRLRYLAFYFAGGFVATMTQTAITVFLGTESDGRVPMLGASGAIAAVLGAYFVLYPEAHVVTLVLRFPVPIPAWIFLGGWFIFQLVEAHFGMTSPDQAGGVAFFAHIGGFLFGIIFAKRFMAARRSKVVMS
jgi:membrane associated rhomboid family serine protease